MAVYEPLKSHLETQSADQVSLSFSQVERILGRPLPPSASGEAMRQWWANTDTHSQAKAWLGANRVAKLDASKRTVTFIRSPRSPSTSKLVSGDVLVAGRQLNPAAVRMLEDIAEERDIDVGEALATFINQAALRRRRETLDWFAKNTKTSEASSADLIRSDRDAR